MESVGFKEWALVCEVLGRGEQSLILRKGGIAEGREGFGFRHAAFFLFPTFFHEQTERVRSPDAKIPAQRPGEIEIKFFARLEYSAFVESWEKVVALEPLHILRRNVVRERFEYKSDAIPGIHVGLVRVYRLTPGWIFPDAPRFGGCRSWVTLPGQSREMGLEPVLSTEEHDRRRTALHAIIEETPR